MYEEDGRTHQTLLKLPGTYLKYVSAALGHHRWFSTIQFNLNFQHLDVYTTLPICLQEGDLRNHVIFPSGQLQERSWRQQFQALIRIVIVIKSAFKQQGKTAVERNTEGLDQGPSVLFDLRSNLFFFKQIVWMFDTLKQPANV